MSKSQHMRVRDVFLCSVAFLGTLAGCEDAPPPAQPTAPPTATATAPATLPMESQPPSTAEPRAAASPEDKTVDAEREPRVRARAKELGARAMDRVNMKELKPGDEVILLARGYAGGGSVYGGGPYTLDSSVRAAAVHAGVLKHDELGLVRVKVIKHEGDHPATPANGVRATPWGKYHTSYTLEKVDVR